MHGLIGVAVKKLVETELGEDVWIKVCKVSNFPEKDFVTMDNYEDALIFEIIANVSKESGLSVNDILLKFGHYWVDFAISEGYGHAYQLGGDDFVGFLKNLNKMHTYVATIFSRLAPPHFQVMNDTDEGLDLVYRSQREGLQPMVIGLIEALAIKFNRKIKIVIKAEEPHKTTFKVTYQ